MKRQLGIWLQQEKGKMYYYSAANPKRHHLLTVWLSGNSLSSSSPSTAISLEAVAKPEVSTATAPPTFEPLSTKSITFEVSSNTDSVQDFQQLLDERKELLLKTAKKKLDEAPAGVAVNSATSFIGKMIAFEYKKNSVFYIGLGTVKQMDVVSGVGGNRKFTVVQKYVLSNLSNIEEAVAQETEGLMLVDPGKIFSVKGNWLVFYLDPGN
jgi:hypothetical protein